MPETTVTQRLAAILAADGVGYSRHMARDERATVAALDAARAVFRRHIELNHGRVIDMAGDSVLAVFGAATAAVRAAIDAQQELNATLGPERAGLRFRTGVHLGDVMEKADGTVYGDGVNLAARIEGLAEAGGVAVSDSIRHAVKGSLGDVFDDLGEQVVKNIAEPVRAFRVRVDGAAAPTVDAAPGVTAPGEPLTLPDKPSIAVMPFANMSGDAEQSYFADGVTDEIITELSRFHSLFVIARNSSFTFKDKILDVRTVAKELGVRYVLEGSVRRAGNRVRISAQLIDALAGNHLWAEKYDRLLEDIFAVQDEVTRAIVVAIAPQIDSSEIKRITSKPPDNWSAYELALRASATASWSWGPKDRPGRHASLRYARQAAALDPNCGLAWRTIAYTQAIEVFSNTADSIAEATSEGVTAARRAIAIDPADNRAHLFKGVLLAVSGQSEMARGDIQRAYQLNPNDALTLALSGALCGDPDEAQKRILEALRLSPCDPARPWFLSSLGYEYFVSEDYARGVETAEQLLSEEPDIPAGHLCLALNRVGLGDYQRARAAFENWSRIAPELVDVRLGGEWVSFDPGFRQRATAFLRIAAGLDEPG